jgi:murein DD-endopeptidase MepM/ murein hydrolase activator NlpD
MTNRGWTLLFGLSNRRPFSISLSLERIIFLFSLLLLVGVGISSLTIRSILIQNRESKSSLLVRSWAKNLLRIEEVERKADFLGGELARWVSLDEKARIIADLEPIDPDIRSLGVGGREIKEPPSPLTPALLSQFKTLEDQIEGLKRALIFEEESFKEIIASLETKREILSHTPSIFPVRGSITSYFGKRLNPISRRWEFHKGIDIANAMGTPLVAPANGVVTFTGWKGGFGNLVILNHGYGYTTRFGHLKEMKVQKGERVRRGEIIGYIGRTGRATGSHLHYEVLLAGKPTNPKKYILD